MTHNIQKEQTCWKAVTPLSVRPATAAQPSIGKPLSLSNPNFFSSTNFPRDLSTKLIQQTPNKTRNKNKKVTPHIVTILLCQKLEQGSSNIV